MMIDRSIFAASPVSATLKVVSKITVVVGYSAVDSLAVRSGMCCQSLYT